jgi:hypothetical protein
VLQECLRDIIPIAHTLFVGMARAHRIAAIVKDQTRDDRRRPGPGALSLNSLLGKVCLDSIEELSIEDRRVFAPADLATIDDLANI